MLYRLRYLIGFTAFFAALYFVYKALMKQKAINECYGNKVDAMIVDNEIRTLGPGFIAYFPIYEYSVDGESKRYQSTYPTIRPIMPGTAIKLNYNSITSTIVEQTSVIAETTMAICCIGSAILFLNI